MMKDFGSSYEQRALMHSAECHARAVRCLSTIPKVGFEKHVAFWARVKTEAEGRYPALKKSMEPA